MGEISVFVSSALGCIQQTNVGLIHVNVCVTRCVRVASDLVHHTCYKDSLIGFAL